MSYIFRPYITRNGKRMYPKHAKVFRSYPLSAATSSNLRGDRPREPRTNLAKQE